MKRKKEIDELLSKQRVKSEVKLEWAKDIVEKSISLIEKHGAFGKVENINSRPKEANYKSLTILYSTPFNKLPGGEDQYIIDIWQQGKGKVFSVQWEPFDIINFKRNDWLYELYD